MASLAVVFAVACGSGAPSGPSTGPGGATTEEQPFATWSEAGVTLTVRCMAIPDRSTCSVIGRDEHGTEIAGATLLTRMAARDLPPEELARRSEALLFGEAGAEPVLLGTGPHTSVSPEEESVLASPSREGDVLTYFRMEGEMSPTLMRVRVDLAAGTVIERTNAVTIYAETAPAEDTVCEAWTACSCDMGCASFDHLRTPEGERFRSADRRLYFRRPGGGPLRPLAEETCTEPCLEGTAHTTCALVMGACQAAPDGPVGS